MERIMANVNENDGGIYSWDNAKQSYEYGGAFTQIYAGYRIANKGADIGMGIFVT